MGWGSCLRDENLGVHVAWTKTQALASYSMKYFFMSLFQAQDYLSFSLSTREQQNASSLNVILEIEDVDLNPSGRTRKNL